MLGKKNPEVNPAPFVKRLSWGCSAGAEPSVPMSLQMDTSSVIDDLVDIHQAPDDDNISLISETPSSTATSMSGVKRPPPPGSSYSFSKRKKSYEDSLRVQVLEQQLQYYRDLNEEKDLPRHGAESQINAYLVNKVDFEINAIHDRVSKLEEIMRDAIQP